MLDQFRLTFVTCLMVFRSVFADVYSSYYDVTSGCDITYGIVIEAANNIRSITECCLWCDGNSQCLSVKYDQVNSKCSLNSYRLLYQHNTCTTMIRYAEISARSKRKMINDQCTISSDCSVPISRCILRKCQCEPGYSYKRANERCVTACDSYGSTFTRYPEHAIDRTNDAILYDTNSAEDCMVLCVKEMRFVCRTIEYSPGDQRCFLAAATALTEPDKYGRRTDKDYFQRNCQ